VLTIELSASSGWFDEKREKRFVAAESWRCFDAAIERERKHTSSSELIICYRGLLVRNTIMVTIWYGMVPGKHLSFVAENFE